MTSQGSVGTVPVARLIESLFDQIQGIWILNRRLQNARTLESAGTCIGHVTFLPRDPSVFIDKEGKLQIAAKEMVYHEQGYFEAPNVSPQKASPRLHFSRKYIWRLQQRDGNDHPELSVWFTKPGTETIDDLFHKLSVAVRQPEEDDVTPYLQLEGGGGYLCEEDIYSSSYIFNFDIRTGEAGLLFSKPALKTWTMIHEIRGPQKDQFIQADFSRP